MSINKWRTDFNAAFERIGQDDREDVEHLKCSCSIKFLGYVEQQYITKTDSGTKRAVRAYEAILKQIPTAMEEKVVTPINSDKYDAVDYKLGSIPNYYSLIPMSQNAHKPIFSLLNVDGVVGAHYIVFTHGQYSRVRNDHAAFYRMLDALLLTHTFIFLGCGISDPDIQLVLENLNCSFPGCRPHYMVIPANNLSEDELNCIANNRNLEFLTYENPDGSHSQLLESLIDLDKTVAEKRQEIAGLISW